MSDELQRTTREYYGSETIDEWLQHVYPSERASHFPFGHARALVVKAVVERYGLRPDVAYDIGCGGGQLAVMLAAWSRRVRAVDLSSSMLAHAARTVAAAGMTERVTLIERDFLSEGVHSGEPLGDFAIAMGFLEYCPDPTVFFTRLRGAVASGAIAVVEFRNRLFNASTANGFTLRELDAGTLRSLIEEMGEAWEARRPTRGDIEEYVRLLAGAPLPDAEASPSGVAPFPVDRRQHTFREVGALGQAAGLDLLEILALHPHPFAPILEGRSPATYNALSWALQQAPRNPIVLMTSSSAAAVFRVAR